MVKLTDFAVEVALGAASTPRSMPGTGSVTLDATSTGGGPAAANRQTVAASHIIGATANCLIVVVGYAPGAATDVPAALLGSTPLKVLATSRSSSNVNSRAVTWLYLLNPPTGTATITVNIASAMAITYHAISYIGVDVANPFGTPVLAGAATGTGDSLTPSGGSVIVGVESARTASAGSIGGSQTSFGSVVTGTSNNDWVSGTYQPAGGTASWTWAATDEHAAIAVPVNAAGAWTNLTPTTGPSYVRIADGMTFTRGRQSEQTALASQGSGSLSLLNSDARFTPNNGSSPYAPVQIRRPVRCRVTYSATTYNRWQAFVDDWGNASDSNYGIARVQLSDRLARTVKNKFTSAVDAEILSDNPTAYYPLSDQSGATGAGDLSTLTNPTLLAIGAVGFGTATTVGPDKQSGAGVGVGAYLAGTAPALAFPFGLYSGTVEATVSITTMASSIGWVFSTPIPGGGVSGPTSLALGVDALGHAYVTMGSGGGANAAGTTVLRAGGTYHLAATWTWTPAGTGNVAVYVNGIQEGTGSGTPTSWSTTALAQAGQIQIGGEQAIGSAIGGALATVAVYGYALTAARIADHASGVLTSWSGESTNARFTRVCRVAGLPAAAYGVLASSTIPMGAQPLAGRALSDALNDIAITENGSIYVDQTGMLIFAPRTARYRKTAALTLDASKPGQVLSGAIPVTNDSYLVNDSTVTRSGGAAQRDVDQTSINAYDAKDEQQTIYTSRDDVAGNLAQWHVLSFKDPKARFDQPLEIDVVAFANSGGNVAALLNTDVGTKITVTNLAAHQVPSGSVSLFVEGVADVFTKDTWVIRLVTSPIGLEDSVFLIDTSSIDGPDLIAY